MEIYLKNQKSIWDFMDKFTGLLNILYGSKNGRDSFHHRCSDNENHPWIHQLLEANPYDVEFTH